MMIFLLSATLLMAAGFVWTFWIEPRSYQINRHSVRIRKSLPREIRIIHLSDIHFAGDDPHLGRFFDRLAGEKVDFVFLTGDILDCAAGLESCIQNLKKLRPSCGSFAVFGNHDYYDYRLWDVFGRSAPGKKKPRRLNPIELFQNVLEKNGVRVLRNETVEVSVNGHPVVIHGLDDPVTGRANVRKTLENFQPEKINILLTHTIDVFLDIGEDEIDLSFSGHSHGGQVCAPMIGPIVIHTVFGREFVSGVQQLKGAHCSISRGLGASRYFFFRFLAPPEAIVLTVGTS